MPAWYLYIARCSDNSLYTGVTIDVERRINEHNNCNKKSAKYTRVRRPITLEYQESFISKQLAYQREYRIKQLSKIQKEQLIQLSTT
ncbi:GIY-YIG nuclease family protein [Marinagarivorans cellulosilyticus]|uniref:Endonuclease n=1 Tax=Marinagarivorans cellulosilyticus TaxID=2721545 RepID=A0AAN2BKD9_9GAMM|nr:GIY-YIG nuclease family protein [Marinagarivorans cellulosilyticus]BCD97924.1 putative endonuclease [Marinagarivorans cellulosilyticus]